MNHRPSWKGHIRFGLVSVPVQAYSAVEPGGGKVHFHQLHSECHSRIRYQKVCPIHGEVTNDEIVSGYEYSKGKYAIVANEERENLRDEKDHSVHLDTFIGSDQLDPIYFSGRGYYLLPEPAGEKPYAVLRDAMAKQKRQAIGRVVFSKREQLVLLLPYESLLMMEMLFYQANIRQPEAFKNEVAHPKVLRQELKLAETLIAASTNDRFDFGKYEDKYTERLTGLIGDKIEEKDVVISESEEPAAPPVINLMDALRQSMAKTRQRSPIRRAKLNKKSATRHRRRGAG